jgi:hypothetical protein
MKTTCALPLIGILFTLSLSAQIPNGGFESWVNLGGYSEPIGWLTYNDVITPGPWPAITVEPGTPGAVGNYHAVITTVAVPLGPTIQGWVSVGVTGSHAGFPYTERPAMLTGQWQYGIQPSDTGQVQVALSKWNSISSSTEWIAQGSLDITGDLSAWQAFSVPFTYFSTEAPDTAYVQFVSSIDFASPVAGSFIKVDDLAFAGTVGLDELDAAIEIHAFPNPGTDHFSLSLPPGTHTITLVDATGRTVLQQQVFGSPFVIGTAQVPSGVHIVRVDDGVQPMRWVKE